MRDYLFYEDLIESGAPLSDPPQILEDDPFFFGYTSGTTGFPKGTVICHKNFIDNLSILLYNFGRVQEDDIFLLIMPLIHSNSIWFASLMIAVGGTSYIYHSGGFSPKEILEIIEKEKITITSVVPTMLNLILNFPDKDRFDISSLTQLLVSSAPLLTKTKVETLNFFKGAKMYEGYGSTETGLVTSLKPKDQLRKIRCIGQVAIMKEVKLLDENKEEVGVGEVGELYARGRGILIKEYYKDEKATASSYYNGFFTVGDMARMDEEGYFYLVDRKNDMIISGGENIYPTEIEEVISKHPSVFEVAVVGVPDEKWGEAVKAVVVAKEEIGEEELREFCRKHLAGYKCPKSFDFVKELPKTATGKISRREVRRWYIKDELGVYAGDNV